MIDSVAVAKVFASLMGCYALGYGIGSAILWVMAQAAATDPFETALATATTKVGSYAAALVGLSAVAVVFMIAIKYVKRIPRAS